MVSTDLTTLLLLDSFSHSGHYYGHGGYDSLLPLLLRMLGGEGSLLGGETDLTTLLLLDSMSHHGHDSHHGMNDILYLSLLTGEEGGLLGDDFLTYYLIAGVGHHGGHHSRHHGRHHYGHGYGHHAYGHGYGHHGARVVAVPAHGVTLYDAQWHHGLIPR